MTIMHEITNEGGGEGPGCLMAVAAAATVALVAAALAAWLWM